MPNGTQIHKMKRFCGCARFVFNRALAYQNEQYQADKSFKFSYNKVTNLLPAWKKDKALAWLKECHSQVLQQSLKDLERAFQNFFKHKTKFSKNWQKLKAKISKLHHKIANIRQNHLRQISSHISKKHAIVYIEDLQVANMSKSAKGTVEQHGKNVQQKAGLNRAILDQSWAEFRWQLDYKLAWNGGYLIAVPPHNTSRCCPACTYNTTKDNRQTQAQFECVQCGFTENADVVGAINVLKRGQALLAVQ